MRGISIRSIPTTTRPHLSASNSGTYMESDRLLRHRLANHLVPIQECPMLSRKRAGHDRRAHDLHLPHEEPDIVDRAELQPQYFVRPIEVMQVRRGVVLAGVAVAIFVDRPEDIAIVALADIDPTVQREQRRIAGEAGREDAVEHVDALGDAV